MRSTVFSLTALWSQMTLYGPNLLASLSQKLLLRELPMVSALTTRFCLRFNAVLRLARRFRLNGPALLVVAPGTAKSAASHHRGVRPPKSCPI